MLDTINPRILTLNKIGQSVWYDNLSRNILDSGELARLVSYGVSGLTSNPTIFKAAIADSSFYDSDIKELAQRGLNDEQLCEELMCRDVGAAADLLHDCFKSSQAKDGFASIEVSPFLANNTSATIDSGRKIWHKLSRPNIMIKVPATKEGLPAIQALLDEGINVNVTLIFSVEVYSQVMEAYLAALESRLKRHESLSQISSVASFFVSRVDSICEKQLDTLVKAGKLTADKLTSIHGKVGIANSCLAYKKYQEIFSSDRFKKLEERGAKIQRPLWASTGTKNPAFSPLLYVEELAGADTVNTMPPQTLKALMASPKLETKLNANLANAAKIIEAVGTLGVNFKAALLELQDAGVKSFAQSYTELLASIDKKRKQLDR